MDRMCASHPVFMRCLKPNQQKKAHLFDEIFVRAQVKFNFYQKTKRKTFYLFSFVIVVCWKQHVFEKKDILYDYLLKNLFESKYSFF